MKIHTGKQYTKEHALKNGFKTQNHHAKNELNQSIEQPALNESGIEAKKKDFH